MSAFRFFAVAALTFALAAPALAKSASRTRLLASPNPSTAGQTVTLSAEVDGLGGGAPTGAVKFVDSSAVLGAATLTFKGAGQATLAAGGAHSCALTSAGGVKCWGWNDSGKLGDGTTIDRHAPVSVSGLSSGVVAITAGSNHSCALTGAGAVKCWGYNGNGQLGDGTSTSRSAPVSVSGLSSGVVAITAGSGYTCALTSTGGIKCWGWNHYGQLGDGTTTQRNTPVLVSGLSSGVVAISASGRHACALTSAGAVKCWGENFNGQLGDGTTTDRYSPVSVSGLSSGVVAIATASLHTCALTVAGAVKCWGYNAYGQLGDGTKRNRLTPAAVYRLSNGVVAITAGGYHTCALTGAGAVKCWGYNGNGQLGDGTSTSRSAPVSVSGLSSGVAAFSAGGLHSCATTSSGVAVCWGLDNYGQLGNGPATGYLTPPTVVWSLTTLVRARASLSTRALGVGAHSLRAGFGGDASHTGAIGGVVQIVR